MWREKGRSSIHWCTSQMSPVAGAWPGQRQVTGTPSESHMWESGNRAHRPAYLPLCTFALS